MLHHLMSGLTLYDTHNGEEGGGGRAAVTARRSLVYHTAGVRPNGSDAQPPARRICMHMLAASCWTCAALKFGKVMNT